MTGRVTEMQASDRIHVRFEGVAKEIRIGPKGFDRDLSPTLLAYFYENQRLPYFWSAFAILWGILWSLRKLVFRES